MFKLSKEHEKNTQDNAFYTCVWNKKLKQWTNYEDKEPIVYKEYKILIDSLNRMEVVYLSEFETDNYLVFGFYPTKYCLSFRKRPDGRLGFLGLYGSDTLLSNHKLDNKVIDEEIKKREKYIKKVGLGSYITPLSIKATDEVDWEKKTSVFIMKENK